MTKGRCGFSAIRPFLVFQASSTGRFSSSEASCLDGQERELHLGVKFASRLHEDCCEHAAKAHGGKLGRDDLEGRRHRRIGGRQDREGGGKALAREEILDAVWGKGYFGELKIVDVNVRRLRLKIEDDAQEPKYISTVWGFGYKWTV